MPIEEAIDALRGAFSRARRRRSLEFIAPEVGIHELTLSNFLVGKNVTTNTLLMIEDWVVREAKKEATHA